MLELAFLKPSYTLCLRPLPFFTSSLILVNITTLASTAIPIERIIPAILGSDNTTPIHL